MTRGDRARIERGIIAAIRSGARSHEAIFAHMRTRLPVIVREVDNGLQRLRRRGIIEHDKASGWRLKADNEMSIVSNEHQEGSPFDVGCRLSIGDPDAEGRACAQPVRFYVDDLPVCAMHADECLRDDEYEHTLALFQETGSDRQAVCIVQKVTVGWRWKVELTMLRTYEITWGWYERDNWQMAIDLTATYLRGWKRIR